MDLYLRSMFCQFLIQKFRVLQYADLYNAIKLVNVEGTNKQFLLNILLCIWIFYTSHDLMYEQAETVGTCPNKQFQPKSICFSFQLSRENK